jgi:hypothetical protein
MRLHHGSFSLHMLGGPKAWPNQLRHRGVELVRFVNERLVALSAQTRRASSTARRARRSKPRWSPGERSGRCGQGGEHRHLQRGRQLGQIQPRDFRPHRIDARAKGAHCAWQLDDRGFSAGQRSPPHFPQRPGTHTALQAHDARALREHCLRRLWRRPDRLQLAQHTALATTVRLGQRERLRAGLGRGPVAKLPAANIGQHLLRKVRGVEHPENEPQECPKIATLSAPRRSRTASTSSSRSQMSC